AINHRLRADRSRYPGDKSGHRGDLLVPAGFGRYGEGDQRNRFKPKMMGGGLVGLQATAIKTQLGPLINGLFNDDFWLLVPKMDFPGVTDFLKNYQARAGSEGVDPLGYYIGPWGYAQMEVLAQAIVGTKSLNDDKLADYIRANTFKTVVGD